MSAFAEDSFNLKDAVKFVAEHSYIYETRNVDVYVANMLEKIPCTWREVLSDLTWNELRQVPFGFSKEDWPATLLNFLSHAHRLGQHRFRYQHNKHPWTENVDVPEFIKCKTPAKKLCEIRNMTALIHQLAEKHDCGTIVDIGSGLGYLDQIIHHNFGLKTIGFESDVRKSQAATQRMQLGSCQKNMYHVHQKIENTIECQEIIQNIVEKLRLREEFCNCNEFSSSSGQLNQNVMMVGLHSCGDLMQSMMQLFCELPQVKVFLCAGCCYHKIKLTDFPMSDAGKEALLSAQIEYPDWSVPVTGLRLACQFTRYHWAEQSSEDFAYSEKCLSYRAVLQSFIKTEGLVWRRPKRHLMRENTSSFQDFITKTLESLSLNDSVREEYCGKLVGLFEKKQPLFRYLKVIMVLQQLLQPILEMIVLQDRIEYFREHGIQNDVFLLCEEAISPRNLILYGVK